ncbi:uncharacterized protein LOC108164914 [Drosophila miranda]|uniref:uncharacterized protein LOC108164914 n=1 Tax=Drosophila miranda TaxID=7229 RepID=UPI0007E78D57|nr:uncharacterized protein LOC108164914 [Drosophila miranda]
MPPPSPKRARPLMATRNAAATQRSNRAAPEPDAAEPANTGFVVSAQEYQIDNGSDPTEGCKVELVGDPSIYLGPLDTPYEGGPSLLTEPNPDSHEQHDRVPRQWITLYASSVADRSGAAPP